MPGWRDDMHVFGCGVTVSASKAFVAGIQKL